MGRKIVITINYSVHQRSRKLWIVTTVGDLILFILTMILITRDERKKKYIGHPEILEERVYVCRKKIVFGYLFWSGRFDVDSQSSHDVATIKEPEVGGLLLKMCVCCAILCMS